MRSALVNFVCQNGIANSTGRRDLSYWHARGALRVALRQGWLDFSNRYPRNGILNRRWRKYQKGVMG